MIKCSNCENEIPDKYDDYYNVAHTKILCPECGFWQDVKTEEIEETFPDGVQKSKINKIN